MLVRLAERFGWTLAELEETDTAVLFPALELERTQTAIDRVMHWLDSGGRVHVGAKDWELYDEAMKAQKELEESAGS